MTPAREYYGSHIDDGLEPSEQWNRKKQTKEQKRAAKKAKLDPANQRSALDVMKEQERKRKRELGMADEEGGDVEQKVQKGPLEMPANKRQRQDPDEAVVPTEAERAAKAAKRREKRERKNEKREKEKAKSEAKKARKQQAALADASSKQTALKPRDVGDASEDEHDEDDVAKPIDDAKDLARLDLSGLAGSDSEENHDDGIAEASSVPSSPVADSPAFDVATNQSEASSSSSIVPPRVSEQIPNSQRALPRFEAPSKAADEGALSSINAADPPSGTSSPRLVLPDIDQAILQERLRARIEALRASRKANGPDGGPARSRQELLEQRRKKEEQRKAHKKELRRQAKEEEARKREEQLRGSGSPLSMELFSGSARPSPRPQDNNNFSFGRIAFEDGTAADAALHSLNDPKKAKGPQDPRTALQAAEKKQARLAGLDAEKRADIAEKDMWLNAKKHAHGERVRDDTNLLKKALKRKEKQKGKSEKQWQEREQAVIKGKEAKQKRREANLAKRREEKGGGKGKGGKKGSGKGPGGKKKGRPGFEGRFKA